MCAQFDRWRNQFSGRLALRLLAICCIGLASAAAQDIVPSEKFHPVPESLLVDGPSPASVNLAQRAVAYNAFKNSAMQAWHPSKRALMVRSRLHETEQLLWIASPSAIPEPLTRLAEPVEGGSFGPSTGDRIVFRRDVGGDEFFRLYCVDLTSGITAPISPENARASAPTWSARGQWIAYTLSLDKRRANSPGAGKKTGDSKSKSQLLISDPLRPEATRILATSEINEWSGLRFSPDDKSLLLIETQGNTGSHLWQFDIATGKKTRITPTNSQAPLATDTLVTYRAAEWAADGRSLLAISDRDADHAQLVRIDVSTGKETPITARLKRDVESFAVSAKANRIAFVTSEDGSSVLRFLELSTFNELPRPALLPGEISDLHWREPDNTLVGDDSPVAGRSPELAFTLASARSQGEVFSYDIASTKLTRWTNGASVGLSPLDFVLPRRIEWKSFDDLSISGLLYQPDPIKFPGKRPVQVVIHDGPAGQSRDSFIGEHNYPVNELGVAVLFPNVRGSAGAGKRFRTAAAGVKREDALKDIGALFDWIKLQPDLDASRVLVTGQGEGGYLALATAANFPARITGAMSVAGIPNFVNFLAQADSGHRDQYRMEYGDERDAATRKFLERISPVNQADKITKPMFIIHGKNDSHVPVADTLRLVERLKQQKTPVWFLLANDEGHGFAKVANQNYLFYAQIMFLRRMLLE